MTGEYKQVLARCPIKASDIVRIRRKTHIGDMIMVETMKSHALERDMQAMSSMKTPAIVVGKTNRLAILRLPSGVLDSMRWVDLIIDRDKRRRENGG